MLLLTALLALLMTAGLILLVMLSSAGLMTLRILLLLLFVRLGFLHRSLLRILILRLFLLGHLSAPSLDGIACGWCLQQMTRRKTHRGHTYHSNPYA
ncbi:hypothetical protein FXN63_17685 [Pigmentiphaga aceris]|uniref:Uncharacterized protein n=1 Tax=Pigmentiphaga aceris TaxID=1940612 RepID=A0A5C0B0I4_9BURK|nr:hypothetical protein [Pigmentiphaga aceris]QEI07466.1 hypothetical protein FXN63_17685 [Pigmentiphaga aceris]